MILEEKVKITTYYLPKRAQMEWVLDSHEILGASLLIYKSPSQSSLLKAPNTSPSSHSRILGLLELSGGLGVWVKDIKSFK